MGLQLSLVPEERQDRQTLEAESTAVESKMAGLQCLPSAGVVGP